ncbi:MAG: hypothetical protein MR705_03925 [Flintibacter sp.]|uniref:hypothetical protein n=1 Tax=Eubacteriales incertae sedis TaxID=538999 RepID=UPI00242ED274|nr:MULTISPECIES: hypothetical protein [Eubacteriales incertae sedis]MCI6149572.1 hypothetical protein [Flintibacter sp.]MCI6362677.1 hypothetical protein [Intestinimonas butyriciproducens]
MKSADMIAKIDELIKGPVYHIDIFPCTVHPKHDNRCVEVEKFFQHNRKEIDKKFVNILLKLYCYYDFCVSAWVSKHEVFENPDLDRLISLIEHCFEGEWEARDYINIVLPECNSMIILNGDDLYMGVYHPNESLKNLILELAQSEGLFFHKISADG